jgi:histidyl-tRNA synthetase
MSFIKIPSKGMRDILPQEMFLREYVLNIMKETYKKFGFNSIETPIVEHIENLTNKSGGDNEKLIFKILKRGEKLDLNNIVDETSLVDSGLRYDLTVPLTRYYSNNESLLETPFRSLQIGNVFRAERPQKGRFREFLQCDIDILGEKTNLAEIELITAVITFLKKLDFKDFTIKINDRKILKAMVLYAGFLESDISKVLISLDKMDKIGIDGVKDELLSLGYNESNVIKFLDLFNNEIDIDSFTKIINVDLGVVNNLKEIIDITSNITDARIIFDPTLVRGMNYYTGPIFEIKVEEISSAIGGGGRYDEMISKYSNLDTPACGFSIGFERLILILKERGFKVPTSSTKIALIINDNSNKLEVIKEANSLRKDNVVVKVVKRSKNFKHQIEVLEENNYTYKEI